MNTPPCGAPHHLYPDTLCTEPAGHYRRDRDPHAGPLIVGGRERGGAAWDEPKERRMSDRHTADTITDDALDALYARIATLEHVAAGNKRHVQLIVPELEHAEAALDRVRAVVEALCDEPHPTHDHVCPDDVRKAIRDAIDQPKEQ